LVTEELGIQVSVSISKSNLDKKQKPLLNEAVFLRLNYYYICFITN